ncbi:arrestin domain-containing protein 5-like [Clavelina lepadiformis]|uniref:Arrestin C-terminal-like domain-containing protein n=1 Tax=Clavelina lepadiformis TaxID=159417 RepID=A0ABP0GSY0_CLALP
MIGSTKISPNQISISLSGDTNMFQPGDVVNGFISLHLDKALKIREITVSMVGWCETGWHTSGKDRNIYKEEEEYCCKRSLLWGSRNRDTRILAGEYVKPFVFQLPTNCPSTFQSKHGYVWYIVQVQCRLPGMFGSVKPVTRPIYVYDPVVVSADPSIAELPCLPLPIEGEKQGENFLWMKKPVLSAKIFLDRSAYAPGDQILIDGYLCNKSNSPMNCTLSLNQHIICYARSTTGVLHRSPLKAMEKTTTVATWRPETLLPHEKRNYIDEPTINIPSKNIVSTWLRNCSFLEVHYSLTLLCYTSGFHSTKLVIKNIMLVIGERRKTNLHYHSSMSTTSSSYASDPSDLVEVTIKDIEGSPPSYDEVMSTETKDSSFWA